ncbi:1-phosphofructokinase (plasmid) [Deinococcus proteolyticus MRP]|uniref:1-phosphofructokinase n=1 Tax=Deinococcus proteolyticus (strain ATCC 35074 / DSM 20540 / JCM 6276 / NBRC 101906 / NCIMB 13154 / VKM Ac-1939 / CCM 2703 / MRP) TaxID=693977 RepID=F0RPP3_DEIPM|nr:1-phosphofructokinase [Deinococcus proteolyticus]ADY27349.1 1-phosphofructokinase [Deinococcus proteolyticus MRP]
MKVLTVTLNPALDLTVQAPGWQPGAVNVVPRAQTDAGGKGVNVAALLADWAAQSGEALSVSAGGFLGAGNASAFEALFRERGIADVFTRIPGETRLGVKIVDPQASSTTDFNLPGVQVSAAQLEEMLGHLSGLARQQDAVVLAGSLPPGVPPDLYARAVAALAQGGSGPLLAVDTSGPALRELLQAERLPQLLKPNIHELEAALGRLLPSDADRLDAARELLARGAEWVALSLGEEGAWLVWEGGAVRALPPRVDVVSTVGAGDAMVAGLVSARLAGLDPAAALRRATAFAAGNITRLGAKLPPYDELMALHPQVRLQKGC